MATYYATAEWALRDEPTTGTVTTAAHLATVVTVDTTSQRLTARWTIDTSTLRQAVDQAYKAARDATPDGATLGAVEVIDADTAATRIRSAPPAMVGAVGAGQILNVSKQRVAQLAGPGPDADPDFPPSTDVDGRRVWSRAAVEAYAARRQPRKPGPKPRTTPRNAPTLAPSGVSPRQAPPSWTGPEGTNPRGGGTTLRAYTPPPDGSGPEAPVV
jgi:hypothetical protein